MSTDPMVVDFPDNVGHRQVTFHAPTTFYNDVSFGTTNITTALANKQPLSANLTTLAGGNGSPITTGIPGSAITTGTIDTNRLPATVVLSDRAQTFTANQTLSTATFGGMTLSNWFGNGWNALEWEFNRATFSASSVATSAQMGGLTQQNLNGGSIGITASVTDGHQGINTVVSAADNRAGGSGSFLHRYFNTSFRPNTDNMWVCVWQAYNTNGVMQKVGWDLNLSFTDPTDAARIIATNGVAVFQTINNSTKTNGAPFTIPLQAWCASVMYHTNGSPVAQFWNYTNGVLQQTEIIPGFPTNRSVGLAVGAAGFTSASTNSATTLMLLDDLWDGVRTQGFR